MPHIERHVGVELEFSSSRVNLDMRELYRELKNVVINESNQISYQECGDKWTLKTDHCGYEFTSPALCPTERNLNKIKNIVNGLKEICRNHRSDIAEHLNVCTRSCGMHVHIGVDDLNLVQLKNLLNIFHTYENAIFAINAPSRQNNNFVIPIQSFNNLSFLSNSNRINNIVDSLSNHYHAVNFGRYNERGTIEVRYASSTTSGRKVINWIQLLVFMVEAAKSIDRTVTYEPNQTTEHLKEFILSNRTDTWLDNRRTNLARWIDRRVEQIASYHTAREERRTNRTANPT